MIFRLKFSFRDVPPFVCRDIWIHDLQTGKFTNLTYKEVEDYYPALSANDKTFYFLNERFGNFNIYNN